MHRISNILWLFMTHIGRPNRRLGQSYGCEIRIIYLFVIVAFILASTSIALAQDTSNDAAPSANNSISDRTATGYEIFDLRTADLEVIDGTVIGNRSKFYISFFLEGATYKLAPDQAINLNLPRS